MAIFLLIHGAMHGGWCWREVVPLLEAHGHTALAPTLPGLADDPTPRDRVDLKITADFIADLVRAQPEPVLLTGHSMGGLMISEAAERAAEHIAGLIYVTAALAPAGPRPPDPRFEAAMQAMTLSSDGVSFVCAPSAAAPMFYNRTDPKAAEDAVSRLTPQPIKPGIEPLSVTDARFGRLPRAYVECLDDQAIPIALQRDMQSALPCSPVVTLDTDHSPFLSAPRDLADALISIQQAFAAAGAG
jgi:pimeloyl-ACP methyl ester carboxylesterase